LSWAETHRNPVPIVTDFSGPSPSAEIRTLCERQWVSHKLNPSYVLCSASTGPIYDAKV